MHLLDSYPVIVTPRICECRDFYIRWFGGVTIFEASWFVLLALPGEPTRNLAFMTPDHPSTPPGPDVFSGKGMFLTFQVADAAAEFARLERDRVPFAYRLRAEPWGQKRFALTDPAGTWVDVVEQTDPATGFWEPYLADDAT